MASLIRLLLSALLLLCLSLAPLAAASVSYGAGSATGTEAGAHGKRERLPSRRELGKKYHQKKYVTLKAVAVLTGSAGVAGTVSFSQAGAGSTTVVGRITGLKEGNHGFHVHAFGDTTNGCISTGPHFNPANKAHGGPGDKERHAGDLGNVVANAEGVAEFTITAAQIPLSGSKSIIGRAVVVHAEQDDLGKGGQELSKTTGNSGGRVACGVVGLQAST